MSTYRDQIDREFADLLRRAPAPVIPPMHDEVLRLAAFLEAGTPEAEWTNVLALMWRLQHEMPGVCQGCTALLCVDRGWLAQDRDGPIPQAGHDGVMRRYRITDAGRYAAREVLP